MGFMPDNLFENEFIRQGILLGNELAGPVRSGNNGGDAMQVGEILGEILNNMRWGQARLAKAVGVSQGTISKWMSGQQSPNLDQWEPVTSLIRSDPRLAHLRYEVAPGSVAVMGRVGAGAIIEPDIEQIPPDGLYSVTLPFPIPAEMIGFVVEGDSMYSVYEPGHVIVVYRDQRLDTASYVGQVAVVRTEDGRRFLKRIYAGKAPGLYRLDSINAAPIEDVGIAWVGEIFTHLPPRQVFRVEQASAKAGRKSPTPLHRTRK